MTNPKSIVRNGKWFREDTEVVRKIQPNEMKAAFSLLASASSKSIEVPLGSICALVENGTVVDVLPPGRRTTQGWFEELMEQLNLSKSSVDFYFISRQSLGIPVSTKTSGSGNVEQTSKVMISGDVAHTFTDPARLTQFLQHFVGDKTSISLEDVQHQLKPEISNIIDDVASSSTSKNLRSRIQSELAGLEKITGLRFSVRTTLTKSSQTLSFHLGLVDVPSEATCPTCPEKVRLGSRFCVGCGKPQTLRPSQSSKTETVAMITNDGQHIELDVNIRISGVKPFYTGDFEFGQQVASAMADAVRGLSLAEVCQPSALNTLETTLLERLEMVLTSHEVERCTILDLRSKKEDWLFKTKADMEQVRLELQATKQWLDIGSEELSMEMQVEEFIASRTAAEREQALVGLAAKLEFDRKRDATKLENQEHQAEAALSAAEAAFVLQQRKDELAEQKSEHAGAQNLKSHERQHALDQLLAGLNHDAKIATFKRDTAYNRMVRTTQMENLGLARAEELDTIAHEQTVSDIKRTHQQTQAKTTQEHNLDMQGTQNTFDNAAAIAAAKTESEIKQINLGSEMSGLQARDALAADQEARRLARDLKQREENRKDKAQDIEAAESLLKSKQDHEIATMDARMRLVTALDGKSVGQVMALSAAFAGRALTDGESQAIAKIESGEDETRANMMAEFIEKNGAQHTEMLNFFQSIISTSVNATAQAASGDTPDSSSSDSE